MTAANQVTVTITRPANTTAYAGGDAVGVADADTAANAGSAILEFAGIGNGFQNGHARITSSDLRINLDAVPASMTSFTLHLYNEAPAAILDNAVWSLVAADRTKYLGSLAVGTPADAGGTLWISADALNKHIKLAGPNVYGVLVTAGGYTPSSGEVIAVTLRAVEAF